MSRRPTYDDNPATDRPSDKFAAEVLAAALSPAAHRLDMIELVQGKRSTLRPIERYEKRTPPSQGANTRRSAT